MMPRTRKTITPQDAAALHARVLRDPAFFAQHILGLKLWSRQREFLEAVLTQRKVGAKGGHACGKSIAGAVAAIHFVASVPGRRAVLLSTSFAGCVARLFGDCARIVRQSKMPIGADVRASSIVFGPGWQIEVVSPDESAGLQGRHAAAGTLVAIDEAQGIAAELWEGAGALVTGEHDRMVAMGNPTSLGTPFHRAFTVDRAAWRCLTFNSEELAEKVERGEEPALPGLCSRAFITDAERTWGRGSGLFASRVLGEFPSEGSEGLLNLADLEAGAALSKPAEALEELGLAMGVDVARYGRDSSTAVFIRDGIVCGLEVWHGSDLMSTAGKVLDLMRQWGVPAERVRIDETGLGGGVVDRLQEQSHYVRGINNAQSPSGDWQHVIGNTPVLNARAESYLAVGRLVARKALIVPSRHQQLWGELSAIRYQFDSAGRLKIESKDELRGRIGKSPDAADALALALCEPWCDMRKNLMWI